MLARSHRFWLDYEGQLLELSAQRDGLRTQVALFVDGDQVGDASGFGRVLTPLPIGVPVAAGSTVEPDAGASDEMGSELPRPTVLVLSALPGTVSRALLLVPRSDSHDADADPDGSDNPQTGHGAALGLPKGAELAGLVTAERHPFSPPPGSFAARLLIFQRNHPRLYASRHVVLAVGKVTAALLGLGLLVRLLLQPVLDWIRDRLPEIDLPSIPWPDIPWPDIPWPDIPLPDIDLPDLAMPSWLRVIIGTAKFWLPVLIAIGVAVAETRRRRARAAREGDSDAHR
ncbi:MAG TPA: hypothetical protein VIQ02_01800 [Jiangellaceae bacterium]